MGRDVMELIRSVDLKGLSAYRAELIGAAVMTVLSFAFYLAWGHGSSEMKRLSGQIDGVRLEIKRVAEERTQAASLDRSVAEAAGRLAVAEGRLRSVREKLPTDRHVSRILSELSENGADARIVAIKPLPPEDRGELARLPFQITMEARYIPFGRYIERMEGLPRLVVVDNFTIAPAEEGSATLTSNIFLSAYVTGYGGGR